MPNDTSLPADVTTLPLLPLRDVVVFPHMVIPLFVGRPKSIKALDVAMDAGKHILLVAQKQAAKDDPTAADLYDIGSVATGRSGSATAAAASVVRCAANRSMVDASKRSVL